MNFKFSIDIMEYFTSPNTITSCKNSFTVIRKTINSFYFL